MSRIAIFSYGLISYLVFFAVFLYGVGFIGGFLTPTALDGAPRTALIAALAVDVGLLAAFALQHSGMARPAFKRWWKQIVPEEAERSTYVLVSSLALAAPTARTRVADRPESQVSPIAVNAVANLAPAEAIRRSQASAMPRPAPTQVPLIAAITGLSMVAMLDTIGL